MGSMGSASCSPVLLLLLLAGQIGALRKMCVSTEDESQPLAQWLLMLPWCPASSSAPAAHESETRKRHRVTALVSVQLRQSQMWLLGSMKSKALLI